MSYDQLADYWLRASWAVSRWHDLNLLLLNSKHRVAVLVAMSITMHDVIRITAIAVVTLNPLSHQCSPPHA